MKNRIIGAILLLVLASLATLAIWMLAPRFLDRQQTETSDAARTKGKVRIAVDNWIGYFPLCSPEMRSTMRHTGYLLECEDDQADYRNRMQRLKDGDLDFAVATIDSYILTGRDFDYPATIAMIIDESKGGDAILARADKVSSLDDLKGKTDIRVAFTPSSPSHYLIKAAADHFNVPELHPVGPLRLETAGSEKARDKLLAGAADVAVLWEPDVSRALEHPNIKKILGTEDTERLIVDILLVNRQFSKKNPALVKHLISSYFRVLKHYRDDPELLRKHIKSETGMDDTGISAMLNGVHWVSFIENCEKWFGIAAPDVQVQENILDTIESTVQILISAGDFSTNPIPDNNPFRLTNSVFLEELFTAGISGFTTGSAPGAGGRGTLETPFSLLSETAWKSLTEVGTLKVEPIIFQSGSTKLNTIAKQVIDDAVNRLKHYPNFRVIVRGHTGTRGDRAENSKLSLQRAEAVARYMQITYNIDANRILTQGQGGDQPLAKKGGEGQRAYEYRLPRVELVLVREEI